MSEFYTSHSQTSEYRSTIDAIKYEAYAAFEDYSDGEYSEDYDIDQHVTEENESKDAALFRNTPQGKAIQKYRENALKNAENTFSYIFDILVNSNDICMSTLYEAYAKIGMIEYQNFCDSLKDGQRYRDLVNV